MTLHYILNNESIKYECRKYGEGYHSLIHMQCYLSQGGILLLKWFFSKSKMKKVKYSKWGVTLNK